MFHLFSKYGNTVFAFKGQTVREKKAHLGFLYIIITNDWTYVNKSLNESSEVFKARPDEAWNNLV